ncbi:MAG: DUF1585 domain-containing protein, partial [Hyphomonas sp.]
EKMQKYAVGRPSRQSDRVWTDRLERSFERQGYRLKPLMRDIALSSEFYAVAIPDAASDMQEATRHETEKKT